MSGMIGVIGAGAMGSGIAQVAAMAGCKVVVTDSNPDSFTNAKAGIKQSLEKLASKNKLTSGSAEEVFGRISFVNDLNAFSDCELVIEAVIEKLDVKQAIFSDLEGRVSNSCILASNTSSLSIASIASSCKHKERVVGIHFFNPPVLMKLVEVIPGITTSRETVDKVYEILGTWNKVIVTAKDTPGFIVNKVARPFYGESLRIFDEGLSFPTEIDAAIKSLGFRMGPFELMDFIGHDVNYRVTETVFEQMFYDPRYKPSLTQRRLFEAGFYGRKSGRGFYQYDKGEVVDTSKKQPDPTNFQWIADRIICMLINEAADTLYMNIANRDDIDNAMINGVNYPQGLLKWCDQIGVKKVVEVLDDLYANYSEDRYRTCLLLRKMADDDQSFYN